MPVPSYEGAGTSAILKGPPVDTTHRIAAHQELAASCALTEAPQWRPIRPAPHEPLVSINPVAFVLDGDILASVHKDDTAWTFRVTYQGRTAASEASFTALSAMMRADREIARLDRTPDTLIAAA